MAHDATEAARRDRSHVHARALRRAGFRIVAVGIAVLGAVAWALLAAPRSEPAARGLAARGSVTGGPGFKVLDSRSLEVRGLIDELSADGRTVAVIAHVTGPFGYYCAMVAVWPPNGMSVQRYGTCAEAPSPHGVVVTGDLGAWIDAWSGIEFEAGIATSRPNLHLGPELAVSNVTSGAGDHVGQLVGDGGLLAWNEWVRDPDIHGKPSENNYPTTSHLTAGSLHAWRRGGGGERTILDGVGSLYVVAASNGRLLVRHPDGSLVVVGGDGTIVRRFASMPATRGPELLPMGFQGDDIVTIRNGTLIDRASAPAISCTGGRWQRRLVSGTCTTASPQRSLGELSP